MCVCVCVCVGGGGGGGAGGACPNLTTNLLAGPSIISGKGDRT